MEYAQIRVPAFNIAGIAIRTTNANGQAMKDIGELWQRFMQQQVLQSIPGRVSDDIVCMYTDYESNFNAPYTTIIGCKVTGGHILPDGLVFKEIPAALYRLYKPVGQLPESIVQTWMNIWQSEIPRAYAADFDVYKQDGSAETYLSVL